MVGQMLAGELIRLTVDGAAVVTAVGKAVEGDVVAVTMGPTVSVEVKGCAVGYIVGVGVAVGPVGVVVGSDTVGCVDEPDADINGADVGFTSMVGMLVGEAVGSDTSSGFHGAHF